MHDIFEEMFISDLNNSSFNEEFKKYKRQDEEDKKIHNDFWESLNLEQKEKFRKFETVLGKDDIIEKKIIYQYALKKGLIIGFSTAKLFFDE